MKKVTKLVLIILIIILGACSKPNTISQVEAERLAAESLGKYVKKENLSFSQFGKPEVRYTEKDAAGKIINVWEVYYVSKNRPAIHVNILINQHGDIEQHHMIDKE